VQAATRAAAVAHAHGLRFIVAPALNLSTVLNPGRRGAAVQGGLAVRQATSAA